MPVIELAPVRKFRRLCAAHGPKPLSRPGTRALSDWIERDACPQVAQFINRNEFRALARAPLSMLQAGSCAPERQFIDRASEALVGWAAALAKFLSKPAHLASLSCVGPYNTWQTEAGTGAADSGGAARAASDRQSLQHIASQPWQDLVCLRDYFELSTGLNLKLASGQDGDLHDRQLLQFTGFGNPDLLSPGNRIVQGLLLRIQHWNEALRSIQVRCQTALSHEPGDRGHDLDQARRAAAEFRSLSDQLRRVLVGTTIARLIEDSVVLVQIYADYFSAVDLDWLPVPPTCRKPQGYAYWLGQREYVAIAERTADALDRIGNALDGDIDVDLWVDLLRNTTPLLIVSGSGRRECYWRGVKLDSPWQQNDVVWLLLLQLALAARKGQAVSLRDFDASPSGSLKHTRARLTDLIPSDLNDLIKAQRPGGYVLRLLPSEVTVIEVESEDRLLF